MRRYRIRIVGAGLIGTSIALKARELGYGVSITDEDQVAARLANDLIGQTGQIQDVPKLVIIATPPKSILGVLQREIALNPSAIFIDTSSVKSKLQREVDSFSEIADRFVSTHPIAGRENSGPQAAQSDLFEGRAWVISSGTIDAVEIVRDFVRDLGAIPYQISPAEHDQLFAQISHLPQLISSALALSLEGAGERIDLAGQGLRDMVRLAQSEGRLWSEILTENQEALLNALDTFEAKLQLLRSAIENSNLLGIEKLFESARRERAKVTGKHGARPRDYVFVNVVIDDRPGQLSAIFNECSQVQVNVEDLYLEHSPRQDTGLIRLALSNQDAHKLQSHLAERGWRAHIQ